MSLCFLEAFESKREGHITEQEFFGHLIAHLNDIRHPDDDLNDQRAGKNVRSRSCFTAHFREFALSSRTVSAEDTPIYGQLLERCSTGDFEATKSAFAMLENNDHLPIPLQSLAQLAAERGHAKILDFLLKKGAKFEGDIGVSATQAADSADMAALLWDRNWRDIRHSETEQQNMLRHSVLQPVEMMEFLVRQGVKIPKSILRSPNMGQTSLPVMKILVRECGTDPLVGTAALMLAVRYGNRDVVEFLCKSGLPVNDVPPELDPREPGMCSPLYTAVQCGDIHMMQLLLQHGADSRAPYAPHHQQSVLEAVQERHDPVLLEVLEKYTATKSLTHKG